MKHSLLPATDTKHPLSTKKHLLIISLLIVSTFLAFWQVTHSDFINLDDPKYVTENRHIQDGLTGEAIRWAFTTLYAEFWHPLTWLSHMVDVQLFGLDPHGHHLTNLLWHLASTLLLFLVFHRMTEALWPSAFVAALFALHPLHVESVAWVAERKDVLSAFFWMLTMGAYAFYVERPGLQRYLVVLLSFAFGLMAKPIVVTLPFVLLLLDYWPLQRFASRKASQGMRIGGSKQGDGDRREGKLRKKQRVRGEGKTGKTADPRSPWAGIRPLLLEKLPLFALVVFSSFLAYIAQREEVMGSLGWTPPSERLANAFISYIVYLGKMFWPTNLAVYYPYPGVRPFWEVLGAVFFFIGVMVVAIRSAKRVPYLTVGWLWYVGTLVPVIGVVQVGSHAMADRYTYIPLIGLFIIVAWGFPELFKNWRFRKEALIALSALCILCLLLLTWRQVGYWRNNITLFEHVLKVTDRNALAYNNRGDAYANLGNHRQAIEDYNKAIELNPKFAEAYNNRGSAYGDLSNHRQAIEDYNNAIELNPKLAEAYYNRGVAYGNLGNYRQAIEDYNKAIELNPKLAEAYYNRGVAYGNLGNHRQAIEDIKTAARLGDESAQKFLKSQAIGW